MSSFNPTECERLARELIEESRDPGSSMLWSRVTIRRAGEQLRAACEEVTRLRAEADASRATLTAECVEHVELSGHIDVAEQAHDYLAHEAIYDRTGKLSDFAEALRIIIDQCDRQRRRANWYEAAYDAGKTKVIEHATAALTAERDELRARITDIADEACGIDRVQSADANLTRIERKLFELRAEVERLTRAQDEHGKTYCDALKLLENADDEVVRLRARLARVEAEAQAYRPLYGFAEVWAAENEPQRTDGEIKLAKAVLECRRKLLALPPRSPTMGERLTDEHLNAMERQARSRLVGENGAVIVFGEEFDMMLAEIRERRAADLSNAEVESLRALRLELVDDEDIPEAQPSIAVLDRILAVHRSGT